MPRKKEVLTENNLMEEKEVVKEKKTSTRKATKSRATINKELRMKAKDIDVEVESLVNGDVFYESRKTGEILEINEIGGKEIISLDLLLDINKRCKKLLRNLVISIVDIYTDDYKVEDILELLDLKDIYILETMNLESVDDFILSNNISELEENFNKIENQNIKDRFIERSVSLYRDGLLDSDAKKRIFEVSYGSEYLYKNI